MATTVLNPDGSLGLTLTPDEQNTLGGLPVGQFDAYITLWLAEHAKTVLYERFHKLSDQDRATVLATLDTVASVKLL